MKIKEVFESHAFLYMLQQRCERPWFDAKAFGINAPKSIKGIFFPPHSPDSKKLGIIAYRKIPALYSVRSISI